jgi:hypothetical protein
MIRTDESGKPLAIEDVKKEPFPTIEFPMPDSASSSSHRTMPDAPHSRSFNVCASLTSILVRMLTTAEGQQQLLLEGPDTAGAPLLTIEEVNDLGDTVEVVEVTTQKEAQEKPPPSL